MANNPTGKGGFREHKEHIWRKGTPENFNEFRSLAVAITNEEAKKDNQPIVINGHKVTVAEAVIRSWIQSGNFQKQLAVIQYAYGKVPDILQGDDKGGPIVIKVVYDRKDMSDA